MDVRIRDSALSRELCESFIPVVMVCQVTDPSRKLYIDGTYFRSLRVLAVVVLHHNQMTISSHLIAVHLQRMT